MQQFENDPADRLTPGEAETVMRRLSGRGDLRAVGTSVGSVSALAAALGVSEAEVRALVEDARVQARSEQIAAGILEHERKGRRKLDVTAAVGAAIALVVMAIVAAGFFVWKGSQSEALAPLPPPSGGIISIGIPEIPPIAIDIGEEIRRSINEERLAELEAERAQIEAERVRIEALTTPQRDRDEATRELKQKIRDFERRLAELKKQVDATPPPSGR